MIQVIYNKSNLFLALSPYLILMSSIHRCVLMLENHGETEENFYKCFLYYINLCGWIVQKENFCDKNDHDWSTAEVNERTGENTE